MLDNITDVTDTCWGNYRTIELGDGYQIKKIQVNPGEAISLQFHHHRSEHWIVLKGTALVVNGDKELTLYENESTFIKQGEVHRLSNPGKITLVIIEVQVGSYLEENDIIRLEDKYNRIEEEN